MRLKYQLFLAVLFGCGLLISLMYTVNSRSFSRGFLGYINSVEVARIGPIIDELATGYETHQSWDWLLDDHRRWGGLLRRHLGSSPRLKGPRPSRSGPPDDRDEAKQASGSPTLTVDPRLLLADRSLALIIGKFESSEEQENTNWLPIRVNQAVVGHVGYRQLKQPTAQFDLVFAEQQNRSLALTALVMIGLCALMAMVLSAHIVRPVLQIRNAVSRIRAGHFEQQLDKSRKDEIGDLARDINQLGLTLKRNLDARQQWLAEISHELRTPVSVLQGELEALLDGVVPVDEDAIRSLHDESLRLSRLINDLHSLTLSDIGALDYRLEPLDLVELVQERCRLVSTQIADQGLSMDTEGCIDSAPMSGDRQRLVQLVDNLLQNSIRYTDPGGRIQVSVKSHNGHWRLHCQDSAPGVDCAQLPRLFEPLYRTDASRSRETGGAGLGLAIVSRIAQAHAASVNASHSELGGLAIEILFPRQTARKA